jgi:hypothetical protein
MLGNEAGLVQDFRSGNPYLSRKEAAMNAIGRFLSAYLSADNVILAVLVVGVFVFSILAARAQARLWKRARHIGYRQRQQQFITEARGHLR